MKTMKFRSVLADLILKGEKSVTWRLFDDKDFRVGDHVTFLRKETLERFGEATITNITLRTLGTLTDADWVGHERFESEDEMYATYRKYYGDKVGPDTEVKIITFTFTPAQEDNPFEDEVVAKEWVSSIEGERAGIRDNELYPMLKAWAARVQPKVIVDIGSGQGICADKVQLAGTRYVGVEPSTFLVDRARAVYAAPNREFMVGNAYAVPLPDSFGDAVISINVWFHLQNLAQAAKELARVLKSGGRFLISTGNPDARAVWESFYVDPKKGDSFIDGKVMVPVNPLSRNLMFFHSNHDMITAIKSAGLVVDVVQPFGNPQKYGSNGLFVNIEGSKP